MKIPINKHQINSFCKKHKIKKLMFFGSVLRDDFNHDSDIDAVVEFFSDKKVGMITLAGLEIELSEILGRKAELHTVKGINPLFKNEILADAEVQFEQKG